MLEVPNPTAMYIIVKSVSIESTVIILLILSIAVFEGPYLPQASLSIFPIECLFNRRISIYRPYILLHSMTPSRSWSI